MIFGTNTLNIHPGMHFDKLPLELLVFPPWSFQEPFYFAEVVLLARCTIVPTHPQASMPPALLAWFTLTLLGLCLLNLTLVHAIFSLSLMTFPITPLLHSFVTKMPLYSIFGLWSPGLRPSLVTLTSIHSDHGGEFMAGELKTFFMSKGVTHQTSVPYTPQQNGCAKRFNQTLLEKAEAIHHNACLLKYFWQDAVETALHIYNKQLMHRHDWKMPIESFKGDKPEVPYFRLFGTLACI